MGEWVCAIAIHLGFVGWRLETEDCKLDSLLVLIIAALC